MVEEVLATGELVVIDPETLEQGAGCDGAGVGRAVKNEFIVGSWAWIDRREFSTGVWQVQPIQGQDTIDSPRRNGPT